ncbi:N-carbamoyl-L-amino-acid hydrolase [Roseiarcus fermentans]|uniref:N-carbamoyl-L-amino-acid hydrolase n=1 Tax=Roseiarcus fermentans TaxID=1473586 RepID=A0A366FHB2_9HYPH|nr:Zn-dependent hydrolase [Roseiarcus fermentans]RBP13997.1 N-carbamoyl-L-amino-acid hydrolase [Roseiarcus fermentans]
MPTIDGARLIATLRRLAQFGAYKTGVHRPTFSPEDVQSRLWLAEQFAEAGLEASIDGIGNVFGRTRAPGRKLLIGSHAETQNHAGWLDGALGVVYGLEIARALRDDPDCARLPLEVAAWADEEGHYGFFLGSRSFIGEVSEEEIDRARNNTDGTPLSAALERAGLAGRPRATIVPSDYLGYLEAHIEQGDYLDEAGLKLGVVTGIVGIRQYQIRFSGEQNHAGTTRMARRRDAGAALVALSHALSDRLRRISGPRSVWTTGAIRLDPGQSSIVPGQAEMLFQIRDAEESQLRRFEEALEELVAGADAAGPCAVELKTLWTVAPVPMSERLQAALTQAAEFRAPGRTIAMPSAAGHDAQILAKRIPAAMLFVPSINGVSHHWTEDTSEDDVILGCQALADAAEAIMRNGGV